MIAMAQKTDNLKLMKIFKFGASKDTTLSKITHYLKNHPLIHDPFNGQDRPTDFNVTE